MKQGLVKTKRVGGVHRQEGTALGDMHIPSPIKECIRGIGGIDEYKFLDQRFSINVSRSTFLDQRFSINLP
jgi:hypothetical protein